MNIAQLLKDKEQLGKDILALVTAFEHEHQPIEIEKVAFGRWNGSNTAFGPINKIEIKLEV